MGPVDPRALCPLFYAQALFRRRDWDGCIERCSALLAANPYDRAVWLLKCRALSERAYVDELEWDEAGGAGEALLDDNAVAAAPRPGTSLHQGTSGGRGGGLDAAFRPVTAAGRPVTGFARPGTSAANSGSVGGARVGTSVGAALLAGRAGTARAMTSLGRAVRLGTASLLSAPGGAFLDASQLDLRKYATRPALAKALASYLLHIDHDPRRVLELGSHATTAAGFGDWHWKATLGTAYAALGLLRDAERQFTSALRSAPWQVGLRLHLGRIYLRLDQPSAAIRCYGQGLPLTAVPASTTPSAVSGAIVPASAPAASFEASGGDVSLLLAAARVHERMGNSETAALLWRRALVGEPTCVEAIACLAAAAFYGDQPEVALRHYRRLLQCSGGGAGASAELWVDLGLATFYGGQLDLAMPCLDRALATADGDAVLADVWYNVGCIAISCGDVALATQAFTVALAAEPSHAEANTNLGVLEARRGLTEAAKAHYAAAQRSAPWLYEAWYNGALLAWRGGDVASAHAQTTRALAAFPAHPESKELMTSIDAALSRVFTA